jgi:hypothetical protein
MVGYAGIAIAATLLILREHETASALRAERDALEHDQAEVARLRRAVQELERMQISSAQLESLRADRDVLSRLREEVAGLKARVVASKKSSPPGIPWSRPAGWSESGPSITDTMMPVGTWRNAGRATPATAMETVLWAAAGGDVQLLESLLEFEPEARVKANALLASVPSATRAQHTSPESLIAMLTAKDVPLGSAKIAATQPVPGEKRKAYVVLMTQPPDDKNRPPKLSRFDFQQYDGGWKILVPASVVDGYAAQIRGGVK